MFSCFAQLKPIQKLSAVTMHHIIYRNACFWPPSIPRF